MQSTYIAAGVNAAQDHFWIQNFDPVLWSDDITQAKRFEDLPSLIYAISLDRDTLNRVLRTSTMESIIIYERKENGELVIVEVENHV